MFYQRTTSLSFRLAADSRKLVSNVGPTLVRLLISAWGAWFFCLPIDCSNQLSFTGVRHPFLHRRTSLYYISAFNNFIILMVKWKCHFAETQYEEVFLWRRKCRTPVWLSWLEKLTVNRKSRAQIPAQLKASLSPQKLLKLFENYYFKFDKFTQELIILFIT